MDEATVACEMPQLSLDFLKTQQERLLQNRMRWRDKLARMTDKYKKEKRLQKKSPLSSSDGKTGDVECVMATHSIKR